MESPTMFGEEDILNTILRYGLILGGIFQLACIGACIFALPSPGSSAIECDNSDDNSTLLNSSRRAHYKIRKQEKKKRR